MKTRKLLSVLSTLAILAGMLAVCPVLPSAAETADFTISDNGVYQMDKALTSAPLTLEAEIKFPTTGTGRLGVLLGNWCYPVGAFADYDVNASGNPRLYWGKSSSNNETLTFTDVNLFTGEWLHLAIVIDVANTQVHCYVDGELKQTLTTKYTEPIVCSNAFAVGNNIRQGNGYNFRGAIKSLALYNDVRTATEVAADVTAYGTDGLMTRYDMEGLTEGDTLTDTVSGNNAKWEQKWLDSKDPVGDYDYAIAVLGDPQTVTRNYPTSLPKIYQYVADTAEEKKVAHVFTMGDLTDTTTGVEKEWVAITDAMDILNGVVPHSMLRGNHDDETWYDRYITEERYNDGVVTMDGTMKNYYREITIEGTDYLMVTLDWRPDTDEQAWACEVIEAHPDHRVILTTHNFTNSDGAIANASVTGDGVDIWNRIASKYPNIVLVLSGHSASEDIVMRKAVGINGNTVTHVLVDQQDADQPIVGGTGLIAYFYFSNNGKNVEVEFYSPLRNQYYKPNNQFSFELDIPWDETVPALKAAQDARVTASADTSILRFFGGDISMEATATDDGYKYALDVRPNDGYTFVEENFYAVDADGQKITPTLEADGYYYAETTGGGTVYASFVKGVELPDEYRVEFAADFSKLAALVPSASYADGSYTSNADDTEINDWVNEKFGLFFNQENGMHYEMAHLGQGSNELYNETKYTGNMQWQIRENGAIGMTVSGTSGQLMRKHLALTAKTADGSYAQMGNFEAEVVFNKAGKNEKVGGVYVSFHEKYPGRAHFGSNAGLPVTSTTGNMVVVCNTPAAYAYGGYVDTVSVIAGIESTTDTRIAEVSTTSTWDTAVDYKLYVKVLGTTLTWSVTNLSTDAVVASGADEIAEGNGTVSVGVASGEHEIKSVKINSLDHVLSFHGGTVTVDTTETDNGYRYTLNVQAEEGYALDENNLYVEDANGEKVTLTAGEDGVYYAETSGGGRVLASFLKIPKEIKKFTADFSKLAALVPAETYTDGVYTSGSDTTGENATDTAVNAWFNSKFGMFYNKEGAYKQMTYLGQSTADGMGDTDTNRALQWKISQDGALEMTATSGKNGQYFRKGVMLAAKDTTGEYINVSNFEAEVVFNKAGKNIRPGGLVVSFREKSPGGVIFKSTSTYLDGSKSGDIVAVGNALASYSYEGFGDTIAIHAGVVKNNFNCRAAEAVLDVAWSTTDEYKLYVKAVGTVLTWSLTNLTNSQLIATGTDEIAVGSGTISVGVFGAEHQLKSFTVTELDAYGNAVDLGYFDPFSWTVTGLIPYSGSSYTVNSKAWYTFAGQTTDEANTIIAALENSFDTYYNQQNEYFEVAHGARGNDINDETGATIDVAGFDCVYANKWLQRNASSILGGNSENMRLISSLVPKKNGTAMQLKNFETTVEVDLETANDPCAAFVFGFRQQTPGKFVNGWKNVNKEQGLIVLTNTGISIGAGESITTDFYNADSIPFETSTSRSVRVYIKVVENAVTVKVTNLGDSSMVYYDNSASPAVIDYDTAGYIAYGISDRKGNLGNISLQPLSEQPENTAVIDEKTGIISVKAADGYELEAGSLIITDANGVKYIPQRVNFREEGDAALYEVIDEGFDPVGASASYFFMKPSLKVPNIGNIGNSYNSSLNGLRFVSRFTREVVEGTEYVVTAGGNKYAISDYGMLVSSKPGLDANTDLTAEQAMSLNAEMAPVGEYVQKLSIVEEQKFYDVCDDHIDMAVTLINIDKVTGYGAYEDIQFYARPYVVVKVAGVDTVLYGDVFNASYGDVAAVQ